MNRVTRTTTALLAAVAATVWTAALPATAHASGRTVSINGVAYEDLGVVQVGEVDGPTPLDAADVVLELASNALAAAGTCAPKKYLTEIARPTAHVYYGTIDSIYVWQDLGEAWIEGCPNNTVDISVQMTDQPLDGASPPKVGAAATGSGRARTGAVADLYQNYSNVVMATGLSYHQLTTVITATQTDGRTKTAWCSKKSWTYRATLTGPEIVGETRPETVKCAA